MSLTLYSSEDCPHCAVLKKWLDNRDIPYEEKNVSTAEGRKAMQESKNKISGLPAVESDDGTIWQGLPPKNRLGELEEMACER